MDKNRINKDIEVLFEQFASTKLPPFLSYFTNARKVLYKMHKNRISIFEVENDLIKIKFDKIKHPKYIFHKGSEPIKYFAFKNDLSKRGMAIPNPILYFAFVYNIIAIDRIWLEEFYDDTNTKEFLFHSNSPILGREHVLKFEYDDSGIGRDIEKLAGFINEKDPNKSKSYKLNEEKTVTLEGSNPIFLKTDIENYFDNIYTHYLDLSQREPYKKFSDSDNRISYFFKFLDNYNMAQNENHTKGILQGPISSSISAEFLGIAIDSIISVKQTDFVRYVDDYTFFGKDRSKVEEILEDFDKNLRLFSLRRKQEKTIVEKGFPPSNGSNLNELFLNVKFLKGNSYIKRDDISELRNYLSKLSNEHNVPQIRATLTIFKRYIDKVYKIEKINQKLSVFVVPLLLKVAYTEPVVTSHVYQLIDMIMLKSERIEKITIVDILKNDIEYINKYFSETDLQIWHYYIFAKYAKNDIRSQILKNFLKNIKNQTSTVDPVILSFFVKNNFTENKYIFDCMKEIYSFENGTNLKSKDCMTGIGSSRWWILFLELIKYFRNPNIYQKFRNDPNRREDYFEYRNQITPYIGSKKEPKYGEFGIVFDLVNEIE
ncbi:RNA-directed DNA polymerase [Streptococcus uberis]|uniref:RNA-directed DNA polymerase n=1 Tax=Streptococcus uberis TaxID=1349 RepID=UPI001FF59F1B|nr:RNA-directed DNA polymerase [Streptococcus uberis]MCK1160714.1 RNA-directed DNA polymerase [Streptococcus uberis]MCK1162537.1 RNA-directed DNA polymerase [Streptococcus uberis]MCK1232415.1 RNA-directed DNA polymerase [Streptococcus uberis]MCK1234187.1 RNA-directed DNA polymerase [Streptococcus uberis]